MPNYTSEELKNIFDNLTFEQFEVWFNAQMTISFAKGIQEAQHKLLDPFQSLTEVK